MLCNNNPNYNRNHDYNNKWNNSMEILLFIIQKLNNYNTWKTEEAFQKAMKWRRRSTWTTEQQYLLIFFQVKITHVFLNTGKDRLTFNISVKEIDVIIPLWRRHYYVIDLFNPKILIWLLLLSHCEGDTIML